MPAVDLTAVAWAAVQAVPTTLKAFAAAPTPATAWALYTTADPLTTALIGALALGLLCYVLNAVTGNCSFVDKLWSLIPWGYVVHFAAHGPLTAGTPVNARALALAVLTVAWGLRLTYNFARKGGYEWAGEDYRWPELRTKYITYRVAWQLFSFSFIAMYQNVLLLAFATPAWAVTVFDPKCASLTPCDWALVCVFSVLLLGETLADQQQWNFQTAKYALLNAGKSLAGTRFADGFVTSGLWRYSRHPNFFCEICMWWTVYAFSVSAQCAAAKAAGAAAAGGCAWCACANVTVVGAVLLNLLFLGSTTFTEHITATKYPAYRVYQTTTSRLVPWLSSAPRDSDKSKQN